MMEFTRRRIILLLTIIALVSFGYYQYSVIDPFVKDIQQTLINQNIVNKNTGDELHYSGLDSEKYKSQTNQDEIRLSAKSALLLDATSNHILYEKNGFTELAMASTTKIMTCIVALENCKLDEVVTFSSKAASMPDVQLNAKPGEKFLMKDLLYSLMLESHNDTAVAIAEHVGGSMEGFATMMNAKAKELGLEHTHFVTPNGLDAEGHYTTAFDLALITSYAIQNEEFVSIINTPSWNFKTLDSKREYAVSNKDKFLYLMDGAFGVKTGFTNNAGYCFVGALKNNDRTFISVVLGAGWPPNKSYKWKDTTQLMNYGIKFFNFKNLSDYTKELPKLPVLNGKNNEVTLKTEDINLPILLKANDKVYVDFGLPSYVKAPVKKEAEVGYIRYCINDVFFKEYPIYTKYKVDKIDYKFTLGEIVSRFLSFK